MLMEFCSPIVLYSSPLGLLFPSRLKKVKKTESAPVSVAPDVFICSPKTRLEGLNFSRLRSKARILNVFTAIIREKRDRMPKKTPVERDFKFIWAAHELLRCSSHEPLKTKKVGRKSSLSTLKRFNLDLEKAMRSTLYLLDYEAQ